MGFLKRWLSTGTKAAGSAAPSAPAAMAAPLFPTSGMSQRDLQRYNRGWVYAAIRPIAQKLAGQPIRVGRKRARRPVVTGAKAAMPTAAPPWLRAGDVTEDPNHPLLDALADPNEYLVASSLMCLTVFALETSGVAYWWIDEETEPGRTMIWYLAPHWVTPDSDEGKPFSRYIVRPDRSVEAIEIPAERVIRFHLPDPADPMYGSVSPLHAAGKAVMADEALQEAQRRTFTNGATPGLALVVKSMPGTAGVPDSAARPVLNKEQRNGILNAFKAQYAGFLNHGEPLILDGLLDDVRKISNSPEEMDFLQSGETTKARILQVFGTNPIIAGQVEGSNRASATIAAEHFCDYTVNPLAVLISQTMTGWFSAHYGEPRLVVWVEPARVRDPDARRADLDQLARYGAITKDELRSEHGLGPMDEGGDEPTAAPAQPATTPTAVQPADRPDEPVPTKAAPNLWWWRHLTPAEQIAVYGRAKARQKGT